MEIYMTESLVCFKSPFFRNFPGLCRTPRTLVVGSYLDSNNIATKHKQLVFTVKLQQIESLF